MSRIGFFLVIILAILSIGFSLKKPIPYSFPDLKYFPSMPKSLENPVTEEGVDLGRHLFYDPILSKNGDISCATCHKQEFAFADNQAFSFGNQGRLTQRNSMPLFNLAWNKSFFWDGRAKSIESQVFHPVRDSNEMNLNWTAAAQRLQNNKMYKAKFKTAFGNQKIDSVLITKAIGQFLRTLISHESKFDRVLTGKEFLNKEEYAGFVLINDMTKGDCLHCHTTDSDPLGTTGKFSNNGIDKIFDAKNYLDQGLGATTGQMRDNGKFRIPSLRNVAVTAPYMHDGRFQTLEQVLDFYSEGVNQGANVDSKMGFAHQGGAKLTEQEKKQIIAFLHTLTDSVFLSKESFKNPHKTDQFKTRRR